MQYVYETHLHTMEGRPVYKRSVHEVESEFLPVSDDRLLTEVSRKPTLDVYWH